MSSSDEIGAARSSPGSDSKPSLKRRTGERLFTSSNALNIKFLSQAHDTIVSEAPESSASTTTASSSDSAVVASRTHTYNHVIGSGSTATGHSSNKRRSEERPAGAGGGAGRSSAPDLGVSANDSIIGKRGSASVGDDVSKKQGNTLLHLQRRRFAAIERRTPTPGSLTIYLGGGQIHSSSLNPKSTLRQVLARLSEKRTDLSMAERVARDFDGNLVDLDAPLGSLNLVEVVCLLESDPAQSSSAPVEEDPQVLMENYFRKLAPVMDQLTSSTGKEKLEMLSAVTSKMIQQLPLETRKMGLRVHERCFVATDAVKYLQTTYGLGRDHATTLGKALELQGYISHVTFRSQFEDSSTLLYRFGPQEPIAQSFSMIGSALSSASLAISPQMHHMSFWSIKGLQKTPQPGNRRVLHRIASYVPNIVLHHFSSGSGRIEPPLMETWPSALLFADISGFTPLTEKLAALGGRGVEQLTAHLNEYFGLMISIIYNHGGDIVKFAGDALLVIWPTSSPAGLKYSAQSATQCAAALRDELKNFHAGHVPLTLHVGVGVGYITGIHVGGVSNRMEFIIAGQPLEQAAHCEESAKPGEVYISAETCALLGASVAIKTNNKKKALSSTEPEKAVKLLSILKPVPLSQISIPVEPSIAPMIEQYVPPAVVSHLNSGSPDDFLAEIRTVSVMFVNLGMKFVVPTDPKEIYSHKISEQLQRLQNAVVAMQECVAACKGTIRQFIIDDKGSVLIAAFGLPPTSHEDDPVRAVRAATLICHRLKTELQIEPSIGITTGRAFCGAVGSEERREYAMVGDIVNLSARLMAKANGGVLCDRATYSASTSRFTFKSLPPITVKGKTKPIDIFSPQAELTPSKVSALRSDITQRTRLSKQSITDSSGSKGSGAPIVGRSSELDTLTKLLHELKLADGKRPSENQARLLRIEGDVGSGKSKLLVEFTRLAKEEHLTVMTGSAFSMDSLSPYYCWRDIVNSALGLEGHMVKSKLHVAESSESSDADSLRRTNSALLSMKRLKPEWFILAPLLRAVLPDLILDDNATTSQLVGPTRAQKTIDLCVQIIEASSINAIILENAQWMDSMSWNLAIHLLKSWGSNRLLVVSIRPPAPTDTSTFAIEYRALLSAAESKPELMETLHMSNLTSQNVCELIAQRLNIHASGVPASVAEEVILHSSGNPMLVSEVLSVMTSAGEIVTDGQGNCRLVVSDHFALRRTTSGAQSVVGSLITSKIDQLPTSQQLVLKIAAVIGRQFRADLLYDVLTQISTIPYDAQLVVNTFEKLQEGGFIDLIEDDPPVYNFNSGLVPDVIYNLMLFSQRKAVHEKVAEWLEANESISGPIQTTLAYHWKKAEAWTNAIAFTSKCGVRSFGQGAYLEAISMMTDCVETYKQLTPTQQEEYRVQLGSWYRLIGESWLALKDTKKADHFLEEALKALRVATPETGAVQLKEQLSAFSKRLKKLRETTTTTGEVVDYLWAPESKIRMQGAIEAGGKDIAIIYKNLVMIKLYKNKRAQMAFCALEALERAARLDMMVEYAEAAALCILVASVYNLQENADDLIQHATITATNLWKSNKDLLLPLARVHQCAGLYYAGVGRWKQSMESNRECIRNAVEFNNYGFISEATLVNLMCTFFQGEFQSSLEDMLEKGIELAQSNNDMLLKDAVILIRAHMLLSQGHHSRAEKLLLSVSEHVKAQTSFSSTTEVSDTANLLTFVELILATLTQSGIVLLHARTNKGSNLEDSAQHLLEIMESHEPTSVHMALPHFCLVEGFLALAKLNRASPFLLDRAFTCLSNYAAAFPFALPALHMFQGDLEKVNNHHDSAVSKWVQAAQFARQYRTKFYEACAQYRLADDKSLESAKSNFLEMGVLYTRFLGKDEK